MDALTQALVAAGCLGAAVGLEAGAARAVYAALSAHKPLSGDHTDSMVYMRSLWTLGEGSLVPGQVALLASGVLAAMALQRPDGSPWPALAAWVLALAWDVWAWERVAASVKFVSWRRGWRHSARRVAVSDLREVLVVDRRRSGSLWPAWARPPIVRLVLVLRDGKAVKLPRTAGWLGGEARVENLANFVRLQMDLVADNRRRAVADKRAAARRAMRPPPTAAHPSTKVDPLALGRGG